MNRRNILFIKLATLYFLIGGGLGIAILWFPQWLAGNYLRIHGHLMLSGFTLMIIFGIALHVLPRFSGRPLYSETLADQQLWTTNLGLWFMCLGWWRYELISLVGIGGVLQLYGFIAFGYNLARTMTGYQPVASEGLDGRLDDRESPP